MFMDHMECQSHLVPILATKGSDHLEARDGVVLRVITGTVRWNKENLPQVLMGTEGDHKVHTESHQVLISGKFYTVCE